MVHIRLLVLLALPLAVACGPTYPKCDDDSDCKDAEYCVNGQCQLCRSDSDCVAGQQCAGGRCEDIPGYCEGSNDCEAGFECVNNRCAQAASAPQSTDKGEQICQLSPVYFAFDDDGLDPGARTAIQKNAQCMQEREISALHVTGHCDPRGTEEYNLALGDRRARAVKDYLNSLGIAEGSVSSSSMGEEMAQGTDEASYGRDRRVDVRPR